MYETAHVARVQKMTELCHLIEKAINMPKNRVSRSFKNKLEAYRLPFEAMLKDPIMKGLAKICLEGLDYFLEYLETESAEALEKSKTTFEKVPETIERIRKGEDDGI